MSDRCHSLSISGTDAVTLGLEKIRKFVSIPPMHTGDIQQHSADKQLFLLNSQWQLTLELCHFSSEYNPNWPTKFMQAKIQKLNTQLAQQVIGTENDSEKLDKLIHFFFTQLDFKISNPSAKELDKCFLPYVLSSRQGPVQTLMLLFNMMAEKVGLKSQVMACKKYYLVKIYLNEKPYILDMTQQGRKLEPFDIVDLINQGLDFSAQNLDENSVVISYLNSLIDLAQKNNNLELLSMTHSYLMKYQPFNLKHLSERALVAYKIGDYRRAAEDIRSYFLYKSPEVTNYHLKKIYKLARLQVKNLS